MRTHFATAAIIALSGCALQSYPPYRLHPGEALSPESGSTIQVARSFGGPAVYLTYVDGVYVLDFPAMKGYPKDQIEANRLEPKAIELQPGNHTLRVNFAVTDVADKIQVITLLSVFGASQVSYATFMKAADIKFSTEAGRIYKIGYLWDEKRGAEGLEFTLQECGSNGEKCAALAYGKSNEVAQVVARMVSPSELMAR